MTAGAKTVLAGSLFDCFKHPVGTGSTPTTSTDSEAAGTTAAGVTGATPHSPHPPRGPPDNGFPFST